MNAPGLVVSFDIDGTMEFGDPPGPVWAEHARALGTRGVVIGVASDRPRSSQRPLWERHGLRPRFVGGKHDLVAVRAQFVAEHYIHVGDTQVDEMYARLARFRFVPAAEFDLVALLGRSRQLNPSAR